MSKVLFFVQKSLSIFPHRRPISSQVSPWYKMASAKGFKFKFFLLTENLENNLTFGFGIVLLVSHDSHQFLNQLLNSFATFNGIFHKVHGQGYADGVARINVFFIGVGEVSVLLHQLVQSGFSP